MCGFFLPNFPDFIGRKERVREKLTRSASSMRWIPSWPFFFTDAAEYDFEAAHFDGLWVKIPSVDEEEPFNGIFGPLMFDGYIQIDQLDASGRVSMEERESWDFHIMGEEIGYGRKGNISFAANPVEGEWFDQGLRFLFGGTLAIREDVYRNPINLILEGELVMEGDALGDLPPPPNRNPRPPAREETWGAGRIPKELSMSSTRLSSPILDGVPWPGGTRTLRALPAG